MTHDASKNYFDKFIRPHNDDYLFVGVYGRFKNIHEDDIVLLTRESGICKYKVHCIKYFATHKHLDKAVDLCYRPQPFPTELSRLEFLFDLYKKYTIPMFAEGKKKKH
ncbi:MAG TPA: type IIL restriction-modification enzyme MmeI [Ignavibacteria bacterium]